jgi:DNA-binding NtrC family response regulator
MARTGKFREDLYYRIHVVPIQLPPLRERTGDIALLADYFLRVHLVANGLKAKRLTPNAMAALEEHTWPGNVRELENLIQRLVIMVPGDTIDLQHLPQQLLAQSVTAHEAILLPAGGVRFDDEIRELEVALLEAALRRCDGSKAAAARLLHLDAQRMKYLCRKYSL